MLNMNTAKWLLSKYAKWEDGLWKLTNCEPNKELALILQESHLLVTHGNAALESFSLTQSSKCIKSVYKEGTLVVAIKYQEINTKFRVLFVSLEEASNCMAMLSKFIEVRNSEKDGSEETLSALLNKIMNTDEPALPAPESIPEDYPLEAAIQLCILDPGFPRLVSKIDSIIKNVYNDTK